MVLTSGIIDVVPMAWAVISFFITLAFKIVPISFIADPVVPTDTTLYFS